MNIRTSLPDDLVIVLVIFSMQRVVVSDVVMSRKESSLDTKYQRRGLRSIRQRLRSLNSYRLPLM
jgi:hypothetical protein